jgi:putative peptide zinc metalloprotease protein
MQVPKVRNDLQLHAWEHDADGSEQWAISDPLRNQFFVVSRDVVEIFKRLALGDVRKIVNLANREAGCAIGPEDVAKVIDFVTRNNLSVCKELDEANGLATPNQKQQPWWQALIHKYIVFRVSLLYPDKFLDLTQALCAPFFTRSFFAITVLAGLLGIVLSLRDWSALEHELSQLWSFSGVATLFVTLVFVKLVHEFAHAYTAKRYGVRVPVMGITFIVLFPLPFTNTTESWKLYSHRQRFQIAAAGIIAELTLACWATLFWKIAPEGSVQSALFLVATTTWISSLFVNASPFMRFDGYFLLMDYLRLPNLHARSGALAKWHLRESLFGLKRPPPEHFDQRLQRFLIVFAYVTWVYRFLVFLGIALLVYHFFIKAIGVVMFLVEIYYFILRPIFLEFRYWWTSRGEIVAARRSSFVFVSLFVLVAALFVPFGAPTAVPALYFSHEEVVVYAPEDGAVASVHISVGDTVTRGDLLAQMSSDVLEHELNLSQIQVEAAARAVQAATLEPSARGGSGRQQSWVTAVSRLNEAQHLVDILDVVSPVDGTVIDVSPDLSDGSPIAKDTRLVVLRSIEKSELHTFITEELRSRLSEEDEVEFIFNGAPLERLHARVISISPVATRSLPYPELSSAFGGGLQSFQSQNGLELDQPMFEMQLKFTSPTDLVGRWPATVFLKGEKESIVMGVFRRTANLLLREFGA